MKSITFKNLTDREVQTLEWALMQARDQAVKASATYIGDKEFETAKKFNQDAADLINIMSKAVS